MIVLPCVFKANIHGKEFYIIHLLVAKITLDPIHIGVTQVYQHHIRLVFIKILDYGLQKKMIGDAIALISSAVTLLIATKRQARHPA